MSDEEKRAAKAHRAKNMERLRQQFEAGERGALLTAAANFLIKSEDAPAWLREGFIEAYDGLRSGKIASADEAFGHRKRKNKLQRSTLWPAAYVRTVELQFEGWQVDERLFDKVGNDIGLSPASARRAYYSIKKSVESAL